VTPDRPAPHRSVALALLLGLTTPTLAGAAQAPAESSIDGLFTSWTASTPGCAVGVSRDGKIVLEKAYGTADLEHDVPNRPDTIFEAGSVSKQFTAAAVLLLARDGKLLLDDSVRKYVPELPEYAAPITIRHMLTHTSGLRDWGSVESIAGWPRGTRAYTHAHVLDILSRQSRLNFAPGTRSSYSNSGYNLAAIIVARVSGESFADFTRRRIFEPLGMTRTSWRDDFTRIVKDRAVAYAESGGRYSLDMPFENVHGNGGLLTTVGDLLRWNENFFDPKVGGSEFVREAQTPGRLDNGNEHDYAFGLRIGRYKGVPETNHSGTTGSYRAFLARYPDQHLSIAVLCNAGNSTPRQTVHAVADLYLGDALMPEPAAASVTGADLDALEGMYRDIDRGSVVMIDRVGDSLRLDGDTPLVAQSRRRFSDGNGTSLEFDGAGHALVDEGSGALSVLARVNAAQPTPAELEELIGSYTSEDAETTLVARLREGRLELTQRPDTVYPLKPLYTDAFDSDLGTILVRRDAAGLVAGLSIVQGRVWDLRLRRNP
jgi:CubicO group peptidase (beta-lactamase class C family)